MQHHVPLDGSVELDLSLASARLVPVGGSYECSPVGDVMSNPCAKAAAHATCQQMCYGFQRWLKTYGANWLTNPNTTARLLYHLRAHKSRYTPVGEPVEQPSLQRAHAGLYVRGIDDPAQRAFLGHLLVFPRQCRTYEIRLSAQELRSAVAQYTQNAHEKKSRGMTQRLVQWSRFHELRGRNHTNGVYSFAQDVNATRLLHEWSALDWAEAADARRKLRGVRVLGQGEAASAAAPNASMARVPVCTGMPMLHTAAQDVEALAAIRTRVRRSSFRAQGSLHKGRTTVLLTAAPRSKVSGREVAQDQYDIRAARAIAAQATAAVRRAEARVAATRPPPPPLDDGPFKPQAANGNTETLSVLQERLAIETAARKAAEARVLELEAVAARKAAEAEVVELQARRGGRGAWRRARMPFGEQGVPNGRRLEEVNPEGKGRASSREARMIGDVISVDLRSDSSVAVLVEVPHIIDTIENELGPHAPNDVLRHYHFLPRPSSQTAEDSALHRFLVSKELQERVVTYPIAERVLSPRMVLKGVLVGWQNADGPRCFPS